MARHLEARFRFDERGRIEASAGEDRAPRFCVARTPEGVVWRFRSDVSDDVVRALARHAGKEGPLPAGSAPPERQEAMLKLLWHEAPRPDDAVRRYRVGRDGRPMESGVEGAVGDVFDYA